jgi:hypothetical protein
MVASTLTEAKSGSSSSGSMIKGTWLTAAGYRAGTGLACLAVLDGVPAEQAVAYVRRHYHPDAVETPEQIRFVAEFS